jgi:hypothetical protein
VTAHEGTASVSPTYSASPWTGLCGGAPNAWKLRPASSPPVWSVWVPSTSVTTNPKAQLMIASSSSVVNTTGSASVRGVATCVPAGTSWGSCWGADSQKVTGTRAAVGGFSRNPKSSRNLM